MPSLHLFSSVYCHCDHCVVLTHSWLIYIHSTRNVVLSAASSIGAVRLRGNPFSEH